MLYLLQVWLSAPLSSAQHGRSFVPKRLADSMQAKGVSYLLLRNDAKAFRDTEVGDVSSHTSDLQAHLKVLLQRRAALHQQPPLTIPYWAHKKAKASIDRGESDYKNDRFWEEPPF